MTKIKSAVVGLGQIGMGYDYNCNDSSLILTHSSGLHIHSAFDLIAAVDSDPVKRKYFEDKYKRPSYCSIDELSNFENPDLISIAVPTKLHYEIFCSVVKLLKPKVIICEKPVSENYEEALEMLELAKINNIFIFVNYIRRFDPGIHVLKNLINKKEFGEIYKGTVWYSKGLINCASHFIDLIIFLFGEIHGHKIISKGRKWNESDPEPDFILEVNNAKFYFLAAKEECFTIAEMTLIGTKGRIQYLNGGEKILYSKTTDDQLYPNYTILSNHVIEIESSINKIFYHLFDNINKFLTSKSNNKFNQNEYALNTLKTTLDIAHETEIFKS